MNNKTQTSSQHMLSVTKFIVTVTNIKCSVYEVEAKTREEAKVKATEVHLDPRIMRIDRHMYCDYDLYTKKEYSKW